MKKYIILVPIYNDRESLKTLIDNINEEIKGLNVEISIVIINDASSQQIIDNYENTENINSIEIINMKQNRGHARCIASGLKYIFEKKEFDYVIPMDGDGEDRPEEIKNFIELSKEAGDRSIVGERVKRSEGLFFKFCYSIHKLITFTFAGETIKYGNYSCLPKSIVEKMINEKATWSSFSGSLAKVAKDRVGIPSERGTRYFGPSKMSFKNLIIHSLAIISVFKKKVLIRSILFQLVYVFLIHQKISIIMLIPVVSVFALLFSPLAESFGGGPGGGFGLFVHECEWRRGSRQMAEPLSWATRESISS